MFNRVLLSLFFLFTLNLTFAQGLEGIIVERYYMSDANDEADAANNGAVVPLTAGSTTFRVFVDMAADYKFSQIFGNASHNLLVSSTTNFYNDPSYGVIINPGSISASNIRKRTAMIDSWFTTGGASNGKVGILKIEDSDGSVGNQHNLLQNNAGGCYGVPINGSGAQDGMTSNSATTYLVPNALGLGNALDVLDQTAGNNIVISNGAIAALGGIVGPTTSNRVLIAQFTTSGVLSFALNVQLVNTVTGAVENYVASSPGAGELTHPTLSYNSNTAPTISLLTPQNGSTIGFGNYTLSASANDNLGSVSSVEFFVDGISIGSDASAPYELVYNASVGNHSVYAIARDSDCLTAQSTIANITVSSNQAPSVTLSAPNSAVEGSSLTFTASASDPDGSVTLVQFYVDGVLVGSDNTSPYTTSWLASLGTNQQVTAVVTDNTGLTSVSNVVLITVNPNILPTVSITYPFSTTDVTAPELVALTASAIDLDGSVASVAFYVNGELVGTATSEPFIVNWLSVAGPVEIYAIATDSNGGQTTSTSINLVVLDPSTQPYAVGSITQACNQPLYCVPVNVSAAFPIGNVIGYDITMSYNGSDIQPTGNATISDDLINSNYATITINTNVPGQVQISVVLNGSAPAGSGFNGYGTLACIEFSRLSGFGSVDSTLISITSLIESYVTGPMPVSANAAYLYSSANTTLFGDVSYAGSVSPLHSDEMFESNPTFTEVFGVNGTSVSNPNNPAICDEAGLFSHDLNLGTSLLIHREISNASSIQAFVNGADARVAKELLDNQITPTIWQILALDVNLDGFVTAGDISQINQRASLMIGEYQQAWNYDNQGVSNGQPSKDWIFVDESRLSSPAYQLSSTYPADDQIGFSLLRVPAVPFILPSLALDYVQNSATCQDWSTENYKAVLLGDADGSYAITQENTSDTLIFDLSQAVFSTIGASNFIEIPIISSFNTTSIQSFDVATKFNLNKLSFVGNSSPNANIDALSYYNANDQFLRVVASTNGSALLGNDAILGYLKFEILSDCSAITSQDFNTTSIWLNGVTSEYSFINGTSLPEPIQVFSPAPYCSGSPIDFGYGNQIDGQDIVSYEWLFSDGSIANGQNINVAISTVGEVSIQLNLTVNNGCIYQIPATVFINTSPQASFTYAIGADGQTVNFANTSTIPAGSISSYDWNFGDNQSSNEINPSHTYGMSGVYTVTLLAQSALGCTAEFSQAINTVGINERIEMGLSLYPVPAQDFLRVVFNAPIQYQIIDMNGRVVLSQNPVLSSSPAILDIRSLSSGVYMFVAKSSDRILSKQFVKE